MWERCVQGWESSCGIWESLNEVFYVYLKQRCKKSQISGVVRSVFWVLWVSWLPGRVVEGVRVCGRDVCRCGRVLVASGRV